ncbi:MAG: GDP-mannose 4,6-dehydratase [Bacteroidia bacterium]
MTILITGVAGFIGSSLAEKLLAGGHTIVGIDNFDPFYSREVKLRNLEPLKKNERFTFLEADICNEAVYLKKELSNVESIVHLAARAGVRPSLEIPEQYYTTNANGTILLLEFARKNNIHRFVFASSSSVYGKNPDSPWKEDASELMPISPYAASKISAENIGKVYSHLYNIDFVALRFFTVYGPKQRPDLAIHKFFKKIYAGEAIDLYGNGETYRDYTYIEDILTGIEAAIFSDKISKGFNCFNLGNCEQVSLAELVNTIETITGIKAKINRLPEQPGDVKATCADINKSKNFLGYNPHTPITEGLRKFDEWYKKTSNIN